MFRIGILGSENSHAELFAKAFNGLNPAVKGEFDDMRVVATFSTYEGVDQNLVDTCGVAEIAARPEDMLGKVDAVMVTARDGKFHAEYARPFVEAGIPAFVDKPFATDPAEAVALARLAKQKGVPLCGGSVLKVCAQTQELAAFANEHKADIITGSVTAPVSLHNDYGNFFFYSAHLAEICLPVFGYDPQWVTASETSRGVTALLHYADFDVSMHFTDGKYDYSGTVVTAKESKALPISLAGSFETEAREFAHMLRTGEMAHTYEELVQPVFVLQAIYKSTKTGKREPIESFAL